MSAQSINRNGRKPFNLQTLTSILAGNPFPLITQYVSGKVGRGPATITPDSPPQQIQPTPVPNAGQGEKSNGRTWPSLSETLEKAEQAGYEFGIAGGLVDVTEADEKRLAEKAKAVAAISLRSAYDPQQNAGDAEFAEALTQHKATLAELEKRFLHVKDACLTAEIEATHVHSPTGERPVAPQSYIAAASILIGFLPFLTLRDLMVSGAYDDPVFINAVAAAAALVVGFVSTYGLFQAPPLKAGEGSLKAWKLAAGLSLSLFVVRLEFTSSFLLSFGFSAFEFCAICLVEHFASRQRLSAYEWDAARQEKQEKVDVVAVRRARLNEVEQRIQDEKAEIQLSADELSLRDLQARSPQEWEAKVIAASHFGNARAIAENKSRQLAEKARQDVEQDRVNRI